MTHTKRYLERLPDFCFQLKQYQDRRMKIEEHLNKEIENHRKTFIRGSTRDLVDLYLENEDEISSTSVYSSEQSNICEGVKYY